MVPVLPTTVNKTPFLHTTVMFTKSKRKALVHTMYDLQTHCCIKYIYIFDVLSTAV